MTAPEPVGDGEHEQLELLPLRDADFVGRMLGIPRKSVLQYAREGVLPSVRIGRHVRFVMADVLAAIDEQRPRRSRG